MMPCSAILRTMIVLACVCISTMAWANDKTGDMLTDRGYAPSPRPWVPSDDARGAEMVKPMMPFMDPRTEMVRPGAAFIGPNADMFDHVPRPYTVLRQDVVGPRPMRIPDYPLFQDQP